MTTINYQPVQLSEQSKTILEHRYFLKDDDSNILISELEIGANSTVNLMGYSVLISELIDCIAFLTLSN